MQLLVEDVYPSLTGARFDVVVNGQRDTLDRVFEVRLRYRRVVQIDRRTGTALLEDGPSGSGATAALRGNLMLGLFPRHAVFQALLRSLQEHRPRRGIHRRIMLAVVSLALGDVLQVVRGKLTLRQVLLKHWRLLGLPRRRRTRVRTARVFVTHRFVFCFLNYSRADSKLCYPTEELFLLREPPRTEKRN